MVSFCSSCSRAMHRRIVSADSLLGTQMLGWWWWWSVVGSAIIKCQRLIKLKMGNSSPHVRVCVFVCVCAFVWTKCGEWVPASSSAEKTYVTWGVSVSPLGSTLVVLRRSKSIRCTIRLLSVESCWIYFSGDNYQISFISFRTFAYFSTRFSSFAHLFFLFFARRKLTAPAICRTAHIAHANAPVDWIYFRQLND